MRVKAIALLAVAPMVFGAEFWREKKPDDWSDKESKQLASNSPWARMAYVLVDGIAAYRGIDTGFSGRGATIGGKPQEPTVEMPKVMVRWESAEPLIIANGKGEASLVSTRVQPWTKLYYVITATLEPDSEHAKPGMVQGAALKPKGKNQIDPAKVETFSTSEGITTVFMFPRVDLTAEDKDVKFEAKIGNMQVKTKFNLKDMVYNGKLAL